MKVLHVVNCLDTGGAESQLAALVTAERPDAPAQSVVSLVAPGRLKDRIDAAGVPVASLDMANGLSSPRAVLRLAAIIRDERPDVVQSWMYYADLVAALALRLSGRRGATRLHWGVRCSDMDTSRYGRRLRTVIALCARLSHLPDTVIANSEAGRRVHERLGFRARRFVVVPNGIDCERFRPAPEARRAVRQELGIADTAPLLAHVARVDPMKDHAMFLETLERLPGVAALAVGRDTGSLPDRPGLFRLGERTDVERLVAACDLVVSSSAFGEGFSNVLAEGMAAGLPAVATDVGDAAEIVGDCGRIIAPSRPEDLAAAISDLLALPADARAALGRRARERIESRYALARAVARFDALHRGEEADRCAA